MAARRQKKLETQKIKRRSKGSKNFTVTPERLVADIDYGVDSSPKYISSALPRSLSSLSSLERTLIVSDVVDMFVDIDREVINQICIDFKFDRDRVIDYLLELRPLDLGPSSSSSPARTSSLSSPLSTTPKIEDKAEDEDDGKTKVETRLKKITTDVVATPSKSSSSEEMGMGLSELPLDALLAICDHLDLLTLGKLSCVSHKLEKQIRSVYERVHVLNFQRYRNWSDRKILAMIARFPHILSLSLKKCDKFAAFGSLPESCFSSAATIRKLDFSYCQMMRDYDLGYLLEHLEKVESIDLSNSNLGDDALEQLTRARCLETLSLSDCRNISSRGVMRLIQSSKTLRSLILRGTRITKEFFQCFSLPTSLRKLNISKCKRLTDITFGSKHCLITEVNIASNIGLRNIELNLPALTDLNVSSCKYLNSLTLTSPSKLRQANLSGDCNLAELRLGKASALKTINLYQCRSLTAASMSRLAASSSNSLVSIHCGGLIQLLPTTLAELISTCHYLVDVDLSGCKALPSSVLEAARETLEQRKRIAAHRDFKSAV